jgi:excisionase family DNA binding protein
MTRQNLLNSEEAAGYLGVSPRSMIKWRSTGEHGIIFYRVGRSCRYSIADLDAYLAQNRFNGSEA